jgi:hypothetical protein
MARSSWLDEDTDLPNLEARLASLAHFTDALADGVVDTHELEAQQRALVAAIQAVEADLDDATHARVTQLLLELTAYNVMNVLHGLAAERVRSAFTPATGPDGDRG